MSEETDGRRREEKATERGERIRAELTERLTTGGEQTGAALLPQVEAASVSLSEIAFQLQRLAEEGKVVGAIGGVYRIVPQP
jgi:hypothetical protein